MSASDLVLKPRISEKSYGLSKLHGTYIFDVPTNANKLMVAEAVESQFGVTVISVNIAVMKGKRKRTIRRGRSIMGQRNDVKRAYVTLKEGDHVPVFAAIEESEATEDKTAKSKKESK